MYRRVLAFDFGEDLTATPKTESDRDGQLVMK
jgi:hypothetical protein